MGITRNAMEKLGFFRFYGDAAKFNLNESNSLQNDLKVTSDWGVSRAATNPDSVPLTFRDSLENRRVLVRCEFARWPISRVLSGTLRSLDGHSSGTVVADRLTRPTRGSGAEAAWIRLPRSHPPMQSCSRWGLS